jgi:hypothetical protein
LYNIEQADIDITKQSIQEYYCKIELLNRDMKTIDEMSGDLISGSLTIDADSDIRRTCDVTFHVKDKSYLIGSDSKIWIDKFMRIYIGIVHQRSKTIRWYSLGIFIFNDNSYSYDNQSKSLSINCADMMCKLTGTRNGQLPSLTTEIPVDSNIRNAMISTITQLGWVKKYIINDINKLVPYDLKFSTGQSVYDVIAKLRDLYPAWETYFDVDGTFICKQIPTGTNEAVIIDDSVLSDLLISEPLSNSFNGIKNVTRIYGKDTVFAEYKETSVDNPFSTVNIGEEIVQVFADGDYAKITTNELAMERAKYETWKSTYLKDQRSFNMLYIPFLDVNQKISYRSTITNNIETDITKRISVSFLTGTMTVDTVKFYPLYEWL